jgi:hypothetical protein
VEGTSDDTNEGVPVADDPRAAKPTATSQILTTILTAAAGWAAQKAVRSIWARCNGSAPKNAADPNVSAFAAVAFAALAAAVGAIAQRAATRGAERVAGRLHAGRSGGPAGGSEQ